MRFVSPRATIAHRAFPPPLAYMAPMIIRLALALMLVSSLVLPKTGWIVAHWLFGAQTVVICTGTQLITLTLDADGQPVETASPHVHDCALSKAPGADLAGADLPDRTDHARPLSQPLTADIRFVASSGRAGLSRAPPLA